MLDYRPDDSLLGALRDARPSVSPDFFRPDSPEAAELLAKILSMDASADTVRTDGSPIHATAAPYLEVTSVEPHKRGARVWSRRSPLLWISIAAAILIAAVAVPLTISRNSRPPVSVASTWRLTDATSQPGWARQPTIGSDPDRLSCPSTTTCYVAGLSAPMPNGIRNCSGLSNTW
jgi:hypothetical protein